MELDPGRILELAAHWPDLSCMVAGGAVGYLLTIAIERYCLPTVSDPASVKAQKGQTFLICWFVSAMTTTALWSVWDPADPIAVRVVSSIAAAVITSFVYPTLAALATQRWPAIGSAWGKPL